MAALSELERTHWHEQLRHADRVWSDAGLIDSPDVSSSRHINTLPIYNYLSDYRGDQDDPFPHTEGIAQDRHISNVTFSLTNAVHSILSGREPEPIVKPRGGAEADQRITRMARLNKSLLRMVMRDGRFKREADRALQCGLLTPFGAIRHGFTPDIEEYTDGERVLTRFKNEKPDFPWIRFYRPWDIRIDPLANNFDPDQEPRWVAFRDIHTELEVKRNPNLINRKDWTPTFQPAAYKRGKEDERTLSSPDKHKLYEVWTVYDATERKTFGISPGAEKEVRRQDDWQLEWGQLPYSILTLNEQVDSPIGIPFPKLYAHEQAMINRVWTILNAVISRTRRVVFVNGGAFAKNQDQKENLFEMQSLMEFIEVDGPVENVAREIALGVIDPQLVGLLHQLRESIREVMGISNFDRGSRVNVETAAEANQIGAGANVQKSRIQERYELFWQNIMQVSHRATTQIRDDRLLDIDIRGEGIASEFSEQERSAGAVKVKLEDIRGDFDIAVRLNSTLPLDTRDELSRALAVYQALGGPQSNMIQQGNVHREIVDLAEFDPDRWIPSDQQIQQQAAQAQEGQAPDGQPAQVGETQGDQNISSLLAAVGSR